MSFEFRLVDARLEDWKSRDLERELNDLGAEGWAVAAVVGLHGRTLVMRRPVEEPDKPKAKRKS